MKNEFREAAQIRYLTKNDIKFYETKGGLLGAVIDGNDVGRVDLLRLFPLHMKDKYISVRRMSEGHRDRNTEMGIIEEIAPFDKDQKELINHELDRRYFVPEIEKVNNVKEEFGHTYWEVQTNCGERSFTTFDMASSLVRISENSLMLIDVDGSRYLIPDLKKADDKAMKILDIWL
ncbi:MAG: DUF1854 domain-containing protein [Clostridia bacterium]